MYEMLDIQKGEMNYNLERGVPIFLDSSDVVLVERLIIWPNKTITIIDKSNNQRHIVWYGFELPNYDVHKIIWRNKISIP